MVLHTSRAEEVSPRTIRILGYGGTGDALLLTPCFRALKAKYPAVKLVVYCRNKGHRAVFHRNPFIDQLRTASSFTFLRFRCSRHLAASRFGEWIGYTPSHRKIAYGMVNPCEMFKPRPATLIMAEMLDVHVRLSRPELYLSEDEDTAGRTCLLGYRRPIVAFHAYTSKAIKDWPAEKWERLVSLNADCTFVQVGATEEPRINGAIHRLTNYIRESFAVVKNADCFLGSDSSLAHAAAAFDVPRIVLFGPSTPDIWGHEDSANISLNFGCAPCVDLLKGSPCPFGNPCMNGITVDSVHHQLQRIVACIRGECRA